MSDQDRLRGRVRPGRPTSLLAMVVGIGMVLFALSMFSGPMGAMGGPFLYLFVVAALGMAAFHGYNYFSERGAPVMEVDLELPQRRERPGTAAAPAAGRGDFAERLRKLEELRNEGLITGEEYRTKRAEILGEPW